MPLHSFAVQAMADPQVLLRLMGLFAQRSIIPDQLICRQAGDVLLITIQAELPDEAVADLLLHKIRAFVSVDDALRSRAET